MMDWLRFLLMVFYAPVRGMRGMRDRGSLAPVALIAFLSQAAFNFVTEKFAGVPGGGMVFDIFRAARVVAIIAIIVVPILTLVANIFDRRGSFRVVLTQEYAPLAASVFYVLTAANIFSILIATLLHYSGLQAQHVAVMIQNADQARAMLPAGPEFDGLAEQLRDPTFLSYNLFTFFQRSFFCVGAVFAVKDTFRMSGVRAFAVTLIGCLASLFAMPLGLRLFRSPWLSFSATSGFYAVARLLQRHHGQPSREGSFQTEPRIGNTESRRCLGA